MINSLKRGIRQLGSRRIYIYMMLIVPIACTFIFLNLMKEGLPLKVPVAMVDMDHSPTSRNITRNLAAGELIDITRRAETFNDAMRSVQEGKTYGFFYIPRGFEREALSGRTPTLSFYCNMSYYVPGSLSYKGFKIIAVGTSGNIINATITQAGLGDLLGSGVTMPVATQVHPLGNPWMNYNIYLTPSFLFGLLALIIMTVTVTSITTEIKYGTAPEWIATAGGSIRKALVGKLFPQFVIFCVVGIAIEAVMFRYLHFPFHCPAWIMILAMILFVAASQAFGIIATEIAPNLRISLIIVSLTGILSFSVAGFSFPVDKMYGYIAIFAYIIPIRYLFLIYIDQALNGIPLFYSRIYFAALLAFTLVPWLGLGRLKKKCLNPVYVP